MKQWFNTTCFLNVLLRLAENREHWIRLTTKLGQVTSLGRAAADVWLNMSCISLP